MATPPPLPAAATIRLTTAAGQRFAGLSVTVRPGNGATEVWVLAKPPKGLAPKAGDRFQFIGQRDRRTRTVVTAVAADGGGVALTCSVSAK